MVTWTASASGLQRDEVNMILSIPMLYMLADINLLTDRTSVYTIRSFPREAKVYPRSVEAVLWRLRAIQFGRVQAFINRMHCLTH